MPDVGGFHSHRISAMSESDSQGKANAHPEEDIYDYQWQSNPLSPVHHSVM